MIDELGFGELLLRAGVASAMGLSIGWNRELQNKAAGLRTMALVSLGACGMMLAGVEVSAAMHDAGQAVDPLRIGSGVIGGVGFLGAGSIIQSRGRIKGMTTAASIWAAAGLGIACGLGLFRLACVLFALTVVILVALSWLKGGVLPARATSAEGADRS